MVIVFECEIVCNTKSFTIITGVSVAGVSLGDPICHMFLITGVPQSSDLVSPASLSSPETCLFSLNRVMTILHNADKYTHVIIMCIFRLLFRTSQKKLHLFLLQKLFSHSNDIPNTCSMPVLFFLNHNEWNSLIFH